MNKQEDKFKMALKTVDVTFQNLDSSEISLTDVSHYYDSDPTKVVSSLRDDKKKPSSFMADTTTANAQVKARYFGWSDLEVHALSIATRVRNAIFFPGEDQGRGKRRMFLSGLYCYHTLLKVGMVINFFVSNKTGRGGGFSVAKARSSEGPHGCLAENEKKFPCFFLQILVRLMFHRSRNLV